MGSPTLFCHQLTPELCEESPLRTRCCFSTRARTACPGTFDCVAVGEEPDEGASYTHRCRSGDLLRLSRQVFGAAPRAWLMTMSAATFEGGETLSPEVGAAMPAFLARADELIGAALAGGTE